MNQHRDIGLIVLVGQCILNSIVQLHFWITAGCEVYNCMKTLPAKNCVPVQKAKADDPVESTWDHRTEELVSSVTFTTTD